MISFANISIIARKDLKEALHNRWFVLYTLIFGGLALALSVLSQPELELGSLAGYNRTIASLVNLVLLFVPLIGLTFGATSLAGERETGALNYLLAQPVSPAEVVLGKYIGIAAALFGSLTLGFGVAGIAIALGGGGDKLGYLTTVIFRRGTGAGDVEPGFLDLRNDTQNVNGAGRSLVSVAAAGIHRRLGLDWRSGGHADAAQHDAAVGDAQPVATLQDGIDLQHAGLA